jgi:hypothetical protein
MLFLLMHAAVEVAAGQQIKVECAGLRLARYSRDFLQISAWVWRPGSCIQRPFHIEKMHDSMKYSLYFLANDEQNSSNRLRHSHYDEIPVNYVLKFSCRPLNCT